MDTPNKYTIKEYTLGNGDRYFVVYNVDKYRVGPSVTSLKRAREIIKAKQNEEAYWNGMKIVNERIVE